MRKEADCILGEEVGLFGGRLLITLEGVLKKKKNIREGAGLVDGGYDGSSIMFWRDAWLDGFSLTVSFSRLYESEKNKMATIVEMYDLGWGVI